jgi:molybdopterin-containing oxidoreductase family iron-sulfur binding subunit
MEALLLPGAAVYDGRYANNGWLNELPDPVTKATWGNPLLLSIQDARRLGLKEQDVVSISAGAASIEVPVLVQPGQAPGVVGLALGYGRETGAVATHIGVNAYRLIDAASDAPLLRNDVVIRRTRGTRAIPKTQKHYRLEGRENAQAWTMEEYERKTEHVVLKHASLIPDLQFPGHKWEMAVDLSACVGCSACVVACQSENNIAVVGPERIAESREMHWIRIDRYYEGDPEAPSVIHQPVLCQHCDNAPCEIVCPVNATTHSADGLNQMAYNRCVGTRYCSNNCPFKVRHFNFFEYTAFKKAPENLVYNPDVSVRPRGVMEKCTFCIQRIQDARQRAKVEERRLADGDITPACVKACPADAIVFGDANSPDSRVAQLKRSDRGYRMLEELGIKPSITYLADISNPVRRKSKA